MATIKYLLQSISNNSNIYLRLSNGRGNVFKRKVGLSINHKDWSQKGLPKQNNSENKNLTTTLLELKNYVLNRLNEDSSKGVTINGDWLSRVIDIHFQRINESNKSELVTEAVQLMIDNANVRVNSRGGLGLSKSRVNSLKALKRVFIEFQKGSSIKVKDVNVKLANDFLKFQVNELNYALSSSQKKVSDLKSVCYNAEFEGVQAHHQLKKIKAPNVKNNFIVYLTPSELEKIENTTITQDYLQNARKWLVFGCSIGQRGGDLLSITESNIVVRNGLKVIELKQQKTAKNVTIPILDKTEEIINSGLPRKISLVNFNKYIKKVCELSKIDNRIKGVLFDKVSKRKKEGEYFKWQLVTTHICRRTYATNQFGVLSTPLIMQVTGHSLEKTFLSYIGKSSYDYAQQIADFYDKQRLKQAKTPQLDIVKGNSSLNIKTAL